MLCSSTCKRLLHPCTYSRSALRWWPLLLGFFFSGRGGGGAMQRGVRCGRGRVPVDVRCAVAWQRLLQHRVVGRCADMQSKLYTIVWILQIVF